MTTTKQTTAERTGRTVTKADVLRDLMREGKAAREAKHRAPAPGGEREN